MDHNTVPITTLADVVASVCINTMHSIYADTLDDICDEFVSDVSLPYEFNGDAATQQELADLNARYYTQAWRIPLPESSTDPADVSPDSVLVPESSVESADGFAEYLTIFAESVDVLPDSVLVPESSADPADVSPDSVLVPESSTDSADVSPDSVLVPESSTDPADVLPELSAESADGFAEYLTIFGESEPHISAAEFDAELANAPAWLIMMVIVHHLDMCGSNINEIFALADTTTNMTIIEAINDPVRRTYDELRSEIEFRADADICDWINTSYILRAPNVFALLTNIHQISCRGCCVALIQVALTRPHQHAAMLLMQQFVDDYPDAVVYVPINAFPAAATTHEFDDVPVTRDPFRLPANTTPCVDICVICQESCNVASPHDETDPASTTLACSHSFHMPCIRRHYEGTTCKPTCPSCRADIVVL